MQKAGLLFLIIVLILTSFVFAEVHSNLLNIYLNGDLIKFDVEPFVDNQNRTQVPVRFIVENMGYDVEWVQKKQQVIITGEGKEIILTLGSNKALVNGEVTEFDTFVFAKNGRTFVPLRFVSETLGATVDYKRENNLHKILITTAKPTKYVPIPVPGANNPALVSGEFDESIRPYLISLAENKEFMTWMAENYKKEQYDIRGWAFDWDNEYPHELSDIYFSDRHARVGEGWYNLEIRSYNKYGQSKIVDKLLVTVLGNADGKYIADYIRDAYATKGIGESDNKWIKTPSGREFIFINKEEIFGTQVLIK